MNRGQTTADICNSCVPNYYGEKIVGVYVFENKKELKKFFKMESNKLKKEMKELKKKKKQHLKLLILLCLLFSVTLHGQEEKARRKVGVYDTATGLTTFKDTDVVIKGQYKYYRTPQHVVNDTAQAIFKISSEGFISHPDTSALSVWSASTYRFSYADSMAKERARIMEDIERQIAQIEKTHRLQSTLLKIFIGLQVCVIILNIWTMILRRRIKKDAADESGTEDQNARAN